jgi:hypothetical protein
MSAYKAVIAFHRTTSLRTLYKRDMRKPFYFLPSEPIPLPENANGKNIFLQPVFLQTRIHRNIKDHAGPQYPHPKSECGDDRP